MIYMPVAVPGAGKSTLAKQMVNAGMITEHAVVSSDHYREVVSDTRQDMDATPDAFFLCNKIIEARLKRGLDVFMDGTNLNKKFRDRDLRKYCGEYGQDLTIIVSDLPVAELRERNEDREYVVPSEAFERFYSLAAAFEPERYIDLYDATIVTFAEMDDISWEIYCDSIKGYKNESI